MRNIYQEQEIIYLTGMRKDQPHPFDSHIGQRLCLRRKLLGMSQSDLAKCISLTFQQIQKYERGSNCISARRLYEFAAVLHIPPIYFFYGYGEDTLQHRLGNFSTYAIHLVQDYNSIASETVRNSIAAFVREIAKTHHGNKNESGN